MTVPAYCSVLSVEEESKVAALEAAVARVAKDSAAHRSFCTRATFVRYLRARNWNVAKATKMLLATLSWRAEYRPDELRWETIEHEARRGKLFILPKPDMQGRPIVLMRPRNEVGSYDDGADRVRWLVYQLELASHIADASTGTAADGKMAWLIDFDGYSRKNSPPLRVSMQTLHILQSHYPERLGRAVCWKPPFLFDLLWKAVGPFVDLVTREKLVFLTAKALGKQPDAMSQYFDMSQIDESLGGEVPIEQLFDFKAYGERMQQLDTELDARMAAAAGEVAAEGQAATAEPEKAGSGAAGSLPLMAAAGS